MNQATIMTHRTELEDWCRAHGWQLLDEGFISTAQFACGRLTVTVADHGTVLHGGQWALKFDPLTPFAIVVAAVKAAQAEGGCHAC